MGSTGLDGFFVSICPGHLFSVRDGLGALCPSRRRGRPLRPLRRCKLLFLNDSALPCLVGRVAGRTPQLSDPPSTKKQMENNTPTNRVAPCPQSQRQLGLSTRRFLLYWKAFRLRSKRAPCDRDGSSTFSTAYFSYYFFVGGGGDAGLPGSGAHFVGFGWASSLLLKGALFVYKPEFPEVLCIF